MKKTEHYQLNQWDASDRILRTDFNWDNAQLDAALQVQAKSLEEETANRVSAVAAEAGARSAAVAQEHTAWSKAVSDETAARNAAIAAQDAAWRNAVAAETSAREWAVSNEANTRNTAVVNEANARAGAIAGVQNAVAAETAERRSSVAALEAKLSFTEIRNVVTSAAANKVVLPLSDLNWWEWTRIHLVLSLGVQTNSYLSGDPSGASYIVPMVNGINPNGAWKGMMQVLHDADFFFWMIYGGVQGSDNLLRSGARFREIKSIYFQTINTNLPIPAGATIKLYGER